MDIAQPVAQPAIADEASEGRPTAGLPLRHLLNLSVYWLGMNVIWSGLNNIVIPKRIESMLGPQFAGLGFGLYATAAVLLAVAVQPTVGAISDYTISRWGRRKPYIVIGTLLDIVFLWAVATVNVYIALVAFVVLLQFSSNFAQGPFQGYVPDLVPARQVGLASGLMGVMIVLGNMLGVLIATQGLAGLTDAPAGVAAEQWWASLSAAEQQLIDIERQQAFFLPTLALGMIELVTMVLLVATVHEGRSGLSRAGRSWLQVARSTWATDILQQRSYVFLVISRLCYLAVPAVLTAFALFYLQWTHQLTNEQARDWYFFIAVVMGSSTAITTLPAARLSDRVGRKPIIYASFVVAAVGMAGLVLAPSVELALVFVLPVGISAGAFLAVDWALMTDIIPKANSGRYMGLSNVASASATPLGALSGGARITGLALAGESLGLAGALEIAPRAAFALSFVFLILAAWSLRHVQESRRET